jgi:hypothetical protein
MNINKIIEKIETRKNVTKKYFEDCQKIFDFISSLNIDCTITSKSVNAKFFRYYENGTKVSACNSSEIESYSGKVCVYIEKGICNFGIEWDYEFEEINFLDVNYFRIEDMNTAIFSILTQLENLGTREEKANELKKIIEVIQK